jgi:hypothetical protein
MTGRREGQCGPRGRGLSIGPLPSLPRILPGLALAGLACGCGGAAPLLHPAQTLPQGEVRALAGFSSNLAVGELSSASRNAVNEAAGNPGPPSPGDVTYAEGALVAAAIGPGLAPVAGARVGVGAQSEAGLVYTGRAVRLDIRHSFDLADNWALSIGVGGSATLYGRNDAGSIPNVDLGRLHGWGADVPLLVGYQSEGDLYTVWLGARGGWEHVEIDDLTSEPGSGQLGTPPISLSATQFWGGGLVGVAVGFRHLHIAMELDVSYANVTGDYNDTHARVAGVTIAPATALWWHF